MCENHRKGRHAGGATCGEIRTKFRVQDISRDQMEQGKEREVGKYFVLQLGCWRRTVGRRSGGTIRDSGGYGWSSARQIQSHKLATVHVKNLQYSNTIEHTTSLIYSKDWSEFAQRGHGT